MPNCIAEGHHLLISRLINSGREKIIRKYRQAFGIHKSGNMFPLNIFVNYYWKITDDFCFSGLLVKIATKNNFILTN